MSSSAFAVDVSLRDERKIVLTRSFSAPRTLVWEALTTPDLLMRWYGARGWRLVECEIDLRVGGTWRFVSRGPDGEGMGQQGVFVEVDRPGRLVATEVFDDQSYPGESLVTRELVEHRGITTPDEHRATALARGACAGAALPDGSGVRAELRATGHRARRTRRPPPRGGGTTALPTRRIRMNWTLEVVIVPVSDVDAAKAFYADKVGFQVDHDTQIAEGQRVVQLTPPGSGCSIVIGEGVVPEMPPGSLKGLQLVVSDIEAAREELAGRGVKVSDLAVLGDNPQPGGHPLDNVGFVYFSDPDGNAWAVQQISSRAG